MIEPFREVRRDTKVLVKNDEVVVHQIVQFLRRVVGSNSRVEVIGTVGRLATMMFGFATGRWTQLTAANMASPIVRRLLTMQRLS
jgi:hypothetical protein